MKKGRPSLISPEDLKAIQDIWPDIRTSRGLYDKRCELKAWTVIRRMQTQDKITGLEYLRDNVKQHVNDGLLVALGKFPVDYIPGFAIAVCKTQKENPRSVKQWIADLKDMRIMLESDLKRGHSEAASGNQEV